MNNSVFGKTMENIEERVDIRLLAGEKKALKLAALANYDRSTIFEEKFFIAFHMKKTTVRYNKPVYLGMCILNISKRVMYDIHYNYIRESIKVKLNYFSPIRIR